MSSKILLTGAAGFIGFYTAKKLLEEGYTVIGVDNLNDYYSPSLKLWRIEQLKKYPNFKFHKLDIEDLPALNLLFEIYSPFGAIVNLAARAGVRYSIENPFVYMTTNAIGTLNLLELAKEYGIKKFVLASTSSLYAGQPMPFKEDLPVNTPISPYASSKKSAEILCYTYHYLYGIDISILRYFTVYGPAGRPDMSIFRFIYWLMKGQPIEIYGDGSQKRDFTYVEDIAEGTVKALKPLNYEIINLGGNHPYSLREVIEILEELTGKKAKIIYKPFHKADLKATYADITKAQNLLSWHPKTSLKEGLKKTVQWFKENWHWIKDIEIE
jgi:nucleoside-diphosphate-sugar epimerase